MPVKPRPRIAYAITADARDIRYWSGIGYYIGQTLERHVGEVHGLGPLTQKFGLLFKARQYISQRFLRKGYFRHWEPTIVKGYARQIEHRLRAIKADLVFGATQTPAAYLETKLPIVFWGDGGFGPMLGLYPESRKLGRHTIEQANRLEQCALDRCALAIYSSQWAADGVIGYYKVDPRKVRVVPFGANIECDRTIEDVNRMIDARPVERCNLLLMGVDWNRKGCDFAVEVARCLNRMGLPTELTIVGAKPPLEARLPPFVKLLGFISKATPEGLKRINRLFAESHFFILPTIADTFGIVFCEASSFGVPSLARAVGGIREVVKEGRNGRVFDPEASPEHYADYVHALMSDQAAQYRGLARSAFKDYETRLNWDAAERRLRGILEGTVL